MSFNKRRNNDEEKHSRSPKDLKSKFLISNKSFYTATLVSSLTITLLLVILLIIKVTYSISETDIQSICQIAAGLSSLTLAIPLFLKDFDITSNFWRQFYLISLTFLIATFIGLFSFLETNNTETKNIIIYLWFFFSLTISINITNVAKIGKLAKLNLKICSSSNPLLNFFISYFILILSLVFAKGDFLVYGTILFTIYGFYLTLSLMLSILIELFNQNSKEENEESNDLQLKKAIEFLAKNYKSKALDEQNLLDKLKDEVFNNNPEIVSRSRVKELVAEMDLETDTNNPKVSIYNYDYIIPRWTNEFSEILKKSNPNFIILACSKYSYQYSELQNLLSETKFLQNNEDKLYNILSKKSGLSVQLLKENNSLVKKYKVLKFIKKRTDTRDNYLDSDYLLLVSTECNKNSIIVSNQYSYGEGDNFSSEELDFILSQNEKGKVFFDDYLSIDSIKSAIVE